MAPGAVVAQTRNMNTSAWMKKNACSVVRRAMVPVVRIAPSANTSMEAVQTNVCTAVQQAQVLVVRIAHTKVTKNNYF